MVLVDTSIWIDFFQAPESHTGSALVSLIKDHNSVAICGVVLQEVLQGIRNQKSFELVRERLLKFPFVEANLETWLLAASIYRIVAEFETGELRWFDMKPYLGFPAFSALVENGLFMRASVMYGTVAWSDEIDLSPDTLYLSGIPRHHF